MITIYIIIRHTIPRYKLRVITKSRLTSNVVLCVHFSVFHTIWSIWRCINGKHNIIVDTMTAWDGDKIIKALKEHNISPEMIHYVVSTHGHSDHIGNNNLFLQAKHIVGFSVSYKEKYFLHPFDIGNKYAINEGVEIIPTPGHTLSDVTVLVKTKEGVYGIAGDLFEKFEDIQDPNIWVSAGSENPKLQRKNRSAVAQIVDWIVPGHGAKFKVTEEIRNILRNQDDDTGGGYPN